MYAVMLVSGKQTGLPGKNKKKGLKKKKTNAVITAKN